MAQDLDQKFGPFLSDFCAYVFHDGGCGARTLVAARFRRNALDSQRESAHFHEIVRYPKAQVRIRNPALLVDAHIFLCNDVERSLVALAVGAGAIDTLSFELQQTL